MQRQNNPKASSPSPNPIATTTSSSSSSSSSSQPIPNRRQFFNRALTGFKLLFGKSSTTPTRSIHEWNWNRNSGEGRIEDFLQTIKEEPENGPELELESSGIHHVATESISQSQLQFVNGSSSSCTSERGNASVCENVLVNGKQPISFDVSQYVEGLRGSLIDAGLRNEERRKKEEHQEFKNLSSKGKQPLPRRPDEIVLAQLLVDLVRWDMEASSSAATINNPLLTGVELLISEYEDALVALQLQEQEGETTKEAPKPESHLTLSGIQNALLDSSSSSDTDTDSESPYDSEIDSESDHDTSTSTSTSTPNKRDSAYHESPTTPLPLKSSPKAANASSMSFEEWQENYHSRWRKPHPLNECCIKATDFIIPVRTPGRLYPKLDLNALGNHARLWKQVERRMKGDLVDKGRVDYLLGRKRRDDGEGA